MEAGKAPLTLGLLLQGRTSMESNPGFIPLGQYGAFPSHLVKLRLPSMEETLSCEQPRALGASLGLSLWAHGRSLASGTPPWRHD